MHYLLVLGQMVSIVGAWTATGMYQDRHDRGSCCTEALRNKKPWVQDELGGMGDTMLPVVAGRRQGRDIITVEQFAQTVFFGLRFGVADIRCIGQNARTGIVDSGG